MMQAVYWVTACYENFVRQRAGNSFIRVARPALEGTSFKNCWNLWVKCKRNLNCLAAYYHFATSLYDDKWLERVFNRNYLPFTMIISPKMVARVSKEEQKLYKETPEESLSMSMKILSKYDLKTAVSMVMAGVVGDETIKEKLLEELSNHKRSGV